MAPVYAMSPAAPVLAGAAAAGAPEAAIRLESKQMLRPDLPQAAIEVVQGGLRELLRLAEARDIDLAVLGRKDAVHGAGILPMRFLRHSECSVLFVPEVAPARLRRIVVGTDFSDASMIAYRKAVQLASRLTPAPEVLVAHFYEVNPELAWGLVRTEAMEADAAARQEAATRSLESFMLLAHTTGLTVKGLAVPDSYFSPALHLKELAESVRADLVVVGAHGRVPFPAFLLGSVTEKFLYYNQVIASLIVR
jgi:nucleotide-binding universal stress UspA family protein